MKKTFAMALCALAALVLLAACGTPLPEGMDKADIEARAEETADYLADRDYEAFIAMFDEAGQEAITVEQMEVYYDPALDELGAFQSYSATSGGYKDEAGNHYGIVLIEQKFENGSMNHTVTFDAGGNLIGFIRTA